MNNIYQKKKKLLDKLYSLQRFGIKPGLERTLELSSKIGNPHKKIKTIHVAGTNGKGSVCSLIASVLIENGLKTGLYTSPHLIDFNERIQINGKYITDDEIVDNIEELLDHGEKFSATFFEITTVLAFKIFADNNVDIAVIETGMGGRFDSTNIIKPELSIITEIGLEHKQYLGDTIAKIAFEKAGIIKDDIPVYVASKNKIAVKKIIEQAEIKDSAYYLINEDEANIDFKITSELKMDFNFKGIDFSTSLSGKHQIRNHITAYDSIKIFDENISDEVIKKGFENVVENSNLIARMQLIQNNPTIIVDAAHNPQAILNMINAVLRSPYNKDIKIVFAAMKDKEYQLMLQKLRRLSNEIIITRPKNDRALEVELLYHAASEVGYSEISVYRKTTNAFENLLKGDGPYLICGSFFIVGEFLKWHKNKFS